MRKKQGNVLWYTARRLHSLERLTRVDDLFSTDLFAIIEVPDNADQSSEDMGTKYKFWYLNPQLGRCLFKQARPNTGEDWAEKLAAELAQLLGLPHVKYELATFKKQSGSISLSMLPRNAFLQHGNEILTSIISTKACSNFRR